jgi:hypothetical protein
MRDAGGAAVDRLRKRLRGDLDSILLTALRKEPARRYSSVDALSEDLRRHLEHIPVNAREDTLWYRASKFVRRHSGGVTAAAVIGVLGVASTVAMFWQLRVALEAAGNLIPARQIVAPQLGLWLSMASTILAGAAYGLRARLLRVGGALAGGSVIAAIRLLGIRHAYAMGAWSTRFPSDPDPISLFSAPMLFLIYGAFTAAILLVSWRLERRFGWKGPAVLLAVMASFAPLRERLVLDKLMHVINAPFQLSPIMSDVAFWASGLLLGYAAMRLVAGAAGADRLAGMRPVEADHALNRRSENL